MKKLFLFSFIFFVCGLAYSQTYLPAGLKGHWTFDHAANLTHADVGTDLLLVGSQTAIAGPSASDSAVRVPLGSYYRCYHNIPANGAGAPTRVNNYSLMIDFRVNSIGQWYSFLQTNSANNDDGELFIGVNGNIGVSALGYSSFAVVPGEWYRMVVSASMGNHYDCYIDGQIILSGTYQAPDGRFSLEPSSGNNQLLLFADDNGEDNVIDVAQVAIFDHDLTSLQIDSMGGYHQTVNVVNPYLQIPKPNSMVVNWHSPQVANTLVKYGFSPSSLNMATNGTYETFAGKTWHTVQLSGLLPDTTYYYYCKSGKDSSAVYPFHTSPAVTATPTGHLRFVILGDTRTDIAKTTAIADSVKQKCIELFGPEWYKSIAMVMHVGDIVTSGTAISMYQDEYFTPYSTLSCSVPFMVSIGNHEMENAFYYQYMKYQYLYDHTYPDSSECAKYYSFQLGDCKFVAINSNSPVTAANQTNWLNNVMNNAESNPTVDFVFSYAHHPGHTEIWPDGNSAYVQNTVIPSLANYPKHVMYSYGHSHDYERGVLKTGHGSGWDARLLLSGGGGAALDRWRMYTNQTEYPEIHRSFDYYNFQIVDVDMVNKTYTATTYSYGNTDVPTPCVVLDKWHFRKNQAAPQKPSVISTLGQYAAGDTLKATPISGLDSLMSSEFQIVHQVGSFNTPEHDTIRDYENYYLDSAVSFIPINRNVGINLTSLVIPSSWISPGDLYKVRVRYRDMNMKWSPWSDSTVFSALAGINEYTTNNSKLKVFPNPFNTVLNISFKLEKSSVVKIMVYSIKGDLVETLAERSFAAGENTYVWNLPKGKSESLKSGSYIIRLVTNNLDIKERVVLER